MRVARAILGLVAVAAYGLARPAASPAAVGTWGPRASLAAPRQEVGAARLGDRVYVVGGLTGPPLQALATVEAYDPALDAWSGVAPLPAPRDHMGVAALAGGLWVVGGFGGDFAAKSETWRWDPGTNTWSPRDPLPSARGGLWVVAHGGRLYAFGGVNGAGQATRSTFVYDPGTDEWSPGADMPTAREHLNAVAVGAYIHVLGGRGASGSSAAHERYDPAADAWQVLAPLPTARSAAAVASLGGRIWVAGGEVPQLFAVNEVYDVASDTWCTDAPMALPRHGIAAVALDDRIFTPAGGTVQGLAPTASADVFVPGTEPVPPVAPTCAAAPLPCRTPTQAGGATIALRDHPTDDKRDRLAWVWTRGAATTVPELGNPEVSAAYALCLYDADGLAATLRLPSDAPSCAGSAGRWRLRRYGLTYADRTHAPDGVARAVLRAGADGRARASVAAQGVRLPLPAPDGLASPLTVQLQGTHGACFGAVFSFPPATRRDATQLRDRSD